MHARNAYLQKKAELEHAEAAYCAGDFEATSPEKEANRRQDDDDDDDDALCHFYEDYLDSPAPASPAPALSATDLSALSNSCLSKESQQSYIEDMEDERVEYERQLRLARQKV